MSYVEDTEPVGHLTFEGMNVDLSQIPDNEEAAQDAIAAIQWVRLAAVLLRSDDKEMEKHARNGVESFLGLLEGIAPAIGHMRSRLEWMEQASMRMTIIMDRLIRDTEQPMEPPAENVIALGGHRHV